MNLNETVCPIVHMNGDTENTLVGNLRQAHIAVEAAAEALRACSPNARNYYPVEGLFERAREQHRARLVALSEVSESLMREMRGIYMRGAEASR